jgi:tetratricopeptide (TPR) repeat protein
MANAFLNKQMDDSAAAAYRMAAHAGSGSERTADLRATSALNAARLMAQNNQVMGAESMYRLYLTIKPNDMAVKGALATLLNAANRPQEAAAIYDSILTNTDALDAPALFATAGSLFRLAQQDSVNRTMWFRKSARAYEAGLAKSPYDREALFFTSNIYLVLADTQKLLATAQRLVQVDSMNRRSLSLLAQGQQMAGQRPEVVRTLTRRDSLPFEVLVQRFQLADSSASIRGGVQNLKTRELPGFNLTIEFLNARGEVVTTERAEIPTLGAVNSAGAAYDFNLQATGRGIVAYRYKVGG